MPLSPAAASVQLDEVVEAAVDPTGVPPTGSTWAVNTATSMAFVKNAAGTAWDPFGRVSFSAGAPTGVPPAGTGLVYDQTNGDIYAPNAAGTAYEQFISKTILTTKGDLLTHDGTSEIRLPVGADGFAVVADSTQPGGLVYVDITNNLAFIGGHDASTSAFPAGADTGDIFVVTTAGTIDGIDFGVGDQLWAQDDGASTTTFAGNWVRVENLSLELTTVAPLPAGVEAVGVEVRAAHGDHVHAEEVHLDSVAPGATVPLAGQKVWVDDTAEKVYTPNATGTAWVELKSGVELVQVGQEGVLNAQPPTDYPQTFEVAGTVTLTAARVAGFGTTGATSFEVIDQAGNIINNDAAIAATTFTPTGAGARIALGANTYTIAVDPGGAVTGIAARVTAAAAEDHIGLIVSGTFIPS